MQAKEIRRLSFYLTSDTLFGTVSRFFHNSTAMATIEEATIPRISVSRITVRLIVDNIIRMV